MIQSHRFQGESIIETIMLSKHNIALLLLPYDPSLFSNKAQVDPSIVLDSTSYQDAKT